MQLEHTEAQELMRASLREMLQREVPFDRLRELEKAATGDDALWAVLVRDGWLAVTGDGRPTSDTLIDVAIVVEELARRAALVPAAETFAVLLALGGTAAGSRLRDGVESGAIRLTPALYGPDDLPSGAGGTIRDGLLSGQRQAVDYAGWVTHHVVPALDASGAAGISLVSASDPGVTVRPVANVGHLPKANVTYTGVPAEAIGGPAELACLVDIGTVLSAVQCLGSAARALEMTIGYVGNRVQFGRPIGTFQAVQHEVADMATAVDITRFLVYEAIWKLGRQDYRAEDVALAKNWAARTAVSVTMMAHQLHGGIGVTEEYDLNFFSRRAKERALAWASERETLAVLAGSVAEPEQWL